MPSAHLLIKRYWGVVILVLCFVKPTPVSATAQQSCSQGSSCVVGEFVYADDATPIASASCKLTSFAPDTSTFLNAVPLTGTVDAWYGYIFTPSISNQVGTYPTQLCCITNENNICIDKTFTLSEVGATPAPGLTTGEITSAVWNTSSSAHMDTGSFGQQLGNLHNNNLSATDIWSYTNRSLTSFGSLVSDLVNGIWDASPSAHTNLYSYGQQVGNLQNNTISASDVVNQVWNYQNRSLNSYSSLVSSIWNNQKTINQAVATSSADLTELTREVKASRDLLEQLINVPTVSTYLDADPAPKLVSKLNTTKDYVTQIATNIELASTKIGLVTLKWDQLTETDRNQEIQQAITILGTDETKDPKTVIGQLNWLALAWDKPLTRGLYQDVVSLRDDLSAYLTTLQASPANEEQLTYLNGLFARFTSIKVSVGDVSQIESDPTLFGLIKTLKNVVSNLDAQEQAVLASVSDWDITPVTVRPQIVNAIAQSIAKLNQLPALNTLLSPITPSKEFLSNLLALINLNRTVLASGNNEAVAGTWISTDPIRFRTLVHNPSKRISQTAKINYLLPAELTLEQITNTAPEFTVLYDPTAKALRVTGDIQLEPGESKLIDLTTNDIWQIRAEDIDSLRKQAAELVKPLESSGLYTQATAIKSTIDVALDTVIALKDKATTPNGKIQAYHQAQTLMVEVNRQLDKLRGLVTTHQSDTSLMGFIGGAQAIAVWGIIVIFIAGFVFLTLYMRALYQNTLIQPAHATTLTLPLTGPASIQTSRAISSFSLPFELPNFDFLAHRSFNIILTLMSALLLTLMLIHPTNPRTQNVPAVIVNPIPLSQIEMATPSAIPVPTITPIASVSANLIITPANAASSINVRREPTPVSPKIGQITSTEKAVEIEVEGDWYHVQLIEHDPVLTGWIHKDYVSPLHP